MKKVIFILTVLFFSSYSFSQTSGKTGEVQWSLKNGFLAISGNGAMDNFDLKSNRPPWYTMKDSIQSVEIGYGVTNIGSNAFSNSSITSISLPESITKIGSGAFSDCENLKFFDMPNSVKGEIEQNTFRNCRNLEYISLSKNINKIGYYAFAYTKLSTLIIPEGTISIDRFAFFECQHLKSIKLPSTLLEIGEMAFHNCYALTSVNIPEGVSRIENYTFKKCISLNTVNIPESVIYIGYEAFALCENLTELSLPSQLNYIGEWAFYKCKKLASIKIPGSVSLIERNSFQNCSEMTAVEIDEGVTSINYAAFADCSSLTSITIPESVTFIDKNAFENTTKLTSITVKWAKPISLVDHSIASNAKNCKLFVPKEYASNYINSTIWENFIIEGYDYTPSTNIFLQKSITLYPNPASSITTITGISSASLKVIDQLGRILVQKENLADEEALDISGLSRGVYYMSILDQGKSYTLKLIKN